RRQAVHQLRRPCDDRHTAGSHTASAGQGSRRAHLIGPAKSLAASQSRSQRMEIRSKPVGDVTVVELAGELTAQTAGPTRERVLKIAGSSPQSGAKVILDMSKVSFMSSAGLRLLLGVYRTIAGRGGKILLVGLSEDPQSPMALTGFLDLFRH